MTRLTALLLALGSAWCATTGLAACNGDSGGAGCPSLTSSCPATPPSWQNDVEPLIDTYCLSCHSEGGVAPPQFDYTTYDGVFRSRSVMVTQIIQCQMPPSDASPPAAMPSPDQRQTLVSWIACGAPDN